jgi:hypothetical protein
LDLFSSDLKFGIWIQIHFYPDADGPILFGVTPIQKVILTANNCPDFKVRT